MLRDLECQVEMLPDGSIVKECVEVAASSLPMFRDVLPSTGGGGMMAAAAVVLCVMGLCALLVARRG